MTRVHIIHGIHVSEPGDSVGRLSDYFKAMGYDTYVHDYGHIFAFQARWKNPEIARKIGKEIGPEDIVVGHSNGAAIIAQMAKDGVEFKGAVLVNPALDRGNEIRNGCDFVHVYYNRGDSIVGLSRLLLWHPWGAMGRDGYRGTDSRVTNYDCYPDVDGHSDIFRKLDRWGPKIALNVERELYDVS